MPLYVFVNDTPANTPKTAPLVTELLLEPGVISKVVAQFPDGCAGLVHAQIIRGGSVIWPTNSEQDLSSDGFLIEWEDDYPVPQPEAWYLRTWNTDDTYAHKITVSLELRAIRSRVEPVGPPGGAMDTDALLADLNAMFGA